MSFVGKYYSVDAGYKNEPSFLTPYRSNIIVMNGQLVITGLIIIRLSKLCHSSVWNVTVRFDLLKKG